MGSVGSHWRELAPFLETGPDLHVAPPDPDAVAASADLVVLSLPNGRASTLAPALLERGLRVVDLSADYRFTELEEWRRVYRGHGATGRADADLCGEAVYGLPEFNRQAIATARLVACPGCFPTASLLALLPLLQGGLIRQEGIVVDAKTGTSGGGREARQHLLLAEAGEAVAPYGVEGHRHTREIEIQATTLAWGRSRPLRLQFTPHLLPMVRGAFGHGLRSTEFTGLLGGAAHQPLPGHLSGSPLCGRAAGGGLSLHQVGAPDQPRPPLGGRQSPYGPGNCHGGTG